MTAPHPNMFAKISNQHIAFTSFRTVHRIPQAYCHVRHFNRFRQFIVFALHRTAPHSRLDRSDSVKRFAIIMSSGVPLPLSTPMRDKRDGIYVRRSLLIGRSVMPYPHYTSILLENGVFSSSLSHLSQN